MADPVELLSFIPTGSATGTTPSGKRGLGDWAGDLFVNVKNCGAAGNGSQNDTAYIQKALDLAFGPASSPHNYNYDQNLPVYFPPGRYKVSSPTGVLTVTNVTTNGSPGNYTYTLDSVTGLNNGDTVYIDSVNMATSEGDTYANGTRRINVNGGDSTITTIDAYQTDRNSFPLMAAYVSGGTVAGHTVTNVTVSGTNSGNPGNYTYTLDSVAGINDNDTVTIADVVMNLPIATTNANGSRQVTVNVDAKTITTTSTFLSRPGTVAGHNVLNVSCSTNPGTFTYTLDSVSGINNGDTVTIADVVMDDAVATTNANGSRQVNVSGSTIVTTGSFQTRTFAGWTSGGKVRTAALKTWGVQCGRIFGAGRGMTTIENTVSGGITFQTDGFLYSRIEGIQFVSAGGAGSICLLLDMRGTSWTIGAQGNEVSNCMFGGGDILVELFPTQLSQGSENLFINCFFQGNNVSSIGLRNGLNGVANALQQSIIGGNFQMFTDKCIHVVWGSIPIISGVGFQSFMTPTSWDIVINNSSWDAPVISGCRTESVNFLNAIHSSPIVIGCNQTQDTAGVFAYMANGGSIISCVSKNGQAQMPNGGSISESQFGRSIVNHDWLYGYTNSPIFVRNTMVGNTWNGNVQGGNANVLGDGVINQDGAGVLKFVGNKVGYWSNFVVVYQTLAIADLPTPSSAWKGQYCTVRDSDIITPWGSTVIGHGGGVNQVLVFCNGSDWTLAGV